MNYIIQTIKALLLTTIFLTLMIVGCNFLVFKAIGHKLCCATQCVNVDRR